MEVYRFQRSRNKKKLYIFILAYILLVLIRLMTVSVVVEVVQEHPQYGNSFFTSEKQEKSQKVLVLRRLLMRRISSEGVTFNENDFKKGDIVYVRLPYPSIKKKKWYSIRNILYLFSLGIIQPSKSTTVFREIIALPGEKVVYTTSKIISINGPSVHFIESSPNQIPVFDQVKEITLGENEYFLIGVEDYSLDDKLFGATHVSTIQGKSILLLGPKWGIIDYQ